MIRCRSRVAVFLIAAILVPLGATVAAQPNPLFVGMGDSIGEGVQSGDANAATQPFSYLNLVAIMMGTEFPLPLITPSLFSVVGDTVDRMRVDPAVEGLNLSVNGADVHSLLFRRADATTVSQIDSETDLVLFPRLGSQMEIVEALQPQRVACWIGNNDALASVTDFDQLDGFSQLTPLADFTTDFAEIVTRLDAIGGQVVFGTIPDVTRIAYLLYKQDLTRLLGSDFGLPDGSWTSLVVALGLQTGGFDASILNNPNFVLDSSEAANINQRIDEFNDVIRTTAAAHGMGVVDVAALFDAVSTNPPELFGVALTDRMLGGFFSLDGVHPSTIGQVILAQLFIDAFNAHYSLGIPPIPGAALVQFFLTDPHIDKDGDGRVKGRLGAGLLETVAFLLGWSGDFDDAVPGG